MQINYYFKLMIIMSSIQYINSQRSDFDSLQYVNNLQHRKFLLTSYSSQPTKNRYGNIRQLSIEEYNQQDQYLILSNPNVRIFCDSCYKNITIICHVLSQQFDYCVGCFSQLQKFPQIYNVRSTLMYSLTDPDWLCLDEILLLTAFQKWGFGNWGQVKDYMSFNGTKFTKDEIQYHYDLFFLSSQDLNPRINQEVIFQTKNQLAKLAKRFKPYVPKKVLKKSLIQLKSQQLLNPPKKMATLTQQNVLGYNPKRKSFYYDLQYDQKAESMLSDLQFKDDDTPQQIELKFRILQNYNRRLDERLKRYQFTLQHHILDIDYRFKHQFSANKYQKQAFTLFRPFTRFQNHQENQQTMLLIAKNNYYKSLIQGLKKCRKKIDKQGKIENTFDYLSSKQVQLGQSRKVYRVCVDEQSDELNNQQILSKFCQILKKNEEGETNHNLKIIYKSSSA